jgi:NTE family protein
LSEKKIKTGIILSGGGARAAYQVGVLKAIYQLIPKNSHNPFPIICGSSAGAINATILACYAGQYRIGLRRLESVWSNFSVDKVFRSDYKGMFKQTLRFTWHLITGRKGPRFTSLLDNQPLRELLRDVIPFQRLQELINEGRLDALCVTCSDYTDGGSYSFYQGKADIENWQRHRRVGIRDNIHLSHLMASSAIPILFPAVSINHQYFGDGSVGFLSPISPALHLGADKVLVIGLEHSKLGAGYACYDKNQHPSIADVAGNVLDSIFIDSLDSDVERLERINKILDSVPKDLLSQVDLNLKKVENLVISPSKDLGSIADKHSNELPPGISFFFRRLGIEGEKGSNILSYLLFEKSYCKELIKLGYQDAMDKKSDIEHFFRHLG